MKLYLAIVEGDKTIQCGRVSTARCIRFIREAMKEPGFKGAFIRPGPGPVPANELMAKVKAMPPGGEP